MPDAPPFLKVDNVTAGYKRGLPIVHDVSIQVGEGQIVTVIGPNGAGKSTLLKAVAGLAIVESGAITLGTDSILGVSPDRLGRFGLSYVPQTANIFMTLSVIQNLVLAARRCRTPQQECIGRMLEYFPALAERRNVRGRGLSGGQRQMLAIAMALIAEPRIILMDEPTAGLSPAATEQVLALAEGITEDGVSVLLVEQNARMALRISDHAYVLGDGRNRIEGSARDILDDPAIAEVFLGGARRVAA